MKSRFHGKYDNHSTTKCFLQFLVKMSSKITQFQMLPESTLFNFKSLNFESNRSILVNFENIIFMGVGMPDFRKGQVENRDKTGKCSSSQGFEGNFYCLSLNAKNTPNFTIVTPNPLFDSRIEPEN